MSRRFATYGLVLHPDKCNFGRTYLSRSWTLPYGLAEDVRRPLKAALLPEKSRRYGAGDQEFNVITSIGLALGPFVGDYDHGFYLHASGVRGAFKDYEVV